VLNIHDIVVAVVCDLITKFFLVLLILTRRVSHLYLYWSCCNDWISYRNHWKQYSLIQNQNIITSLLS